MNSEKDMNGPEADLQYEQWLELNFEDDTE